MPLNPLNDLQLDRSKSLQKQLLEALTQRIQQGILQPGVRLPGSRRLAQELEVSRNTVSLVYEKLQEEGLLESQLGRGVTVAQELKQDFIAQPLIDHLPLEALPSTSYYAHQLALNTKARPHSVEPFSPGVPDLSMFPTNIWHRLYRANAERHHLLGFQGLQGLPELRQEVAAYLQLSRAVRCTADNIIITAGAQAALNLIAQTLLNPHETVLLEEPGYSGARHAFQAQSCLLEALPLHQGKLNTAELPEVTKAKLLYCTPTHQYPMGGVLDLDERRALLQWARVQQLWILEDDYDSEFSCDKKSPPAIQGMDPRSPVIYMGSFSKTLYPGLRLGYLVVPPALVNIFCHAKSFSTGETSPIVEATLAQFMLEGHFERHLRKMQTLYFKKSQHLLSICRDILGHDVKVFANGNGMHMVIYFDAPCDKSVVEKLKQKNIFASALSSYYFSSSSILTVNTTPANGLVLGFGNLQIEKTEQLIRQLKLILVDRL